MTYETKIYLLIDVKHKYSLALLYQSSWEWYASNILKQMLQSSLDAAVPVQSDIRIRAQAAISHRQLSCMSGSLMREVADSRLWSSGHHFCLEKQ